MKTENAVWMGVGILVGLAVTFYEAESLPTKECETYRVRQKAVTAYVLKPPHQDPEVIRETCPAPKVETAKADQPKAVEAAVIERPHRRRRHRIRRYWR